MVAHRHPGKRHGGQARWGTGLTGMVVGAIATCGLAWAAGIAPAPSFGSSGHVGPGATVAITAPHVSGMQGIYPGGSGDVAVAIANRNDVAVRVTAVDLPSETTYATGYTSSARTTRRAGCSATTSDVVWTGSTHAVGTVQPLATPLVIGAHETAIVTIRDGAYMKMSAPAACEGTYFSMPELIGIGARTDAHAPTAIPATDSWVRR